MTAEEVKQQIRNIPDFPVKGIQFKDITTALRKPDCLRWIRNEMVNLYKDKGITKVVGIESRGFIIAPAVAMELGVGFVPIRIPGKLPAETVEISYQKEYGVDTASAGNIISELKCINELWIWVFLTEDKKSNLIRANIRSRGPYINEIASIFGGGGHKLAAGARLTSWKQADDLIKDLDELAKKFLESSSE